MTSMDEIKERLDQVRENIQKACGRAGRNPAEVNVIAVTKYVDVETTRRVLDVGLTDIGESRAQEAVPKWEQLGERGVWHFIGHLQRNKVKAVVGRFTYVHSLDRYSLARELNNRSEALGQPTRCFIQVNVAGEESKRGLKPEEVIDFAREAAELPWLQLAGLMTMAPFTEDPEEVRPVFRQLRGLQQEIRKLGDSRLDLPHLSMGMSRDYTVAVEEGATFVRLGSVLVGGPPGRR
ncbi:YggS family pyridoxal phosphate-dependent enzyme [Kroppenstedtia eburnea]|uniref:YggS family pyridoxal phosphate-dependent enzyme n=1 Tax=Kroppenstedtia eburnea TaxID=714067 RepID=UPI00020C8727|nr:cell division protein YlmE [Desmospora sp. 8437]